MTRRIVWFSRGAASAVAWMITRRADPECIAVHCSTGSEHEDSDRFEREWAARMNAPVTTIKSQSYANTWDVWTKRRWLAGIDGASCTTELKVKPRLEFQRPGDIHVFGYTADSADVARATRLRKNFFELNIETPLIDAGLTKEGVLVLIERVGIKLPAMYLLGFHNNNCIPCVKATSPNYWALVRLRFPEHFACMARLSRELNVGLCRINGTRSFIDEIPDDWPISDPIVPSCDFLCQLADE